MCSVHKFRIAELLHNSNVIFRCSSFHSFLTSNVQHLDRIPDCFKRDGGDSIVQRIPLASGIDDPKMIEPKVLQRDVHGAREARRVCVLEFEAESFARREDQQVQFRASVGGPVISIPRVDEVKHMFEGKAFPGRAQLRMTQEVPRGGDLEQSMEDATVARISCSNDAQPAHEPASFCRIAAGPEAP